MLKLDKNNDIIIIIDMVNGFVNEGAFSSPIVKDMVPAMANFIKTAINDKIEIIHYTDSHPENAQEFKVYPVHCVIGTKEENPIDELNFPEVEIIKKNSTNGFFAKNPFNYKKNLYIIGCVSEICIFEFSLTAQKYKEQHDLSYTVNVIEDLVKTFDAPNHNHKNVHKKAMETLSERGVNITVL